MGEKGGRGVVSEEGSRVVVGNVDEEDKGTGGEGVSGKEESCLKF